MSLFRAPELSAEDAAKEGKKKELALSYRTLEETAEAIDILVSNELLESADILYPQLALHGTNLLSLIGDEPPIKDCVEVDGALSRLKAKGGEPGFVAGVEDLQKLQAALRATNEPAGSEPEYVKNNSHLTVLKKLGTLYKKRYAALATELTRFQRRRNITGATIVLVAAAFVLFVYIPRARHYRNMYQNFEITKWEQGWGRLGRDKSLSGTQLSSAGKVFEHGLATHAHSRIEIAFDNSHNTFSGLCGLDDDAKNCGGSISCKIMNGSEVLFESPVIKSGTEALPFSVSVKGLTQLLMVVSDGGDGIQCDHADWLDLKLD